MPYVPGNAAEGFCLTCKKDTVQTVLVVEGFQVRSVRCEKCGTEGPLKMPRHKTRAGLQAAIARKAKASGTKMRTRKPKSDPAAEFRTALAGRDLASAKEYSVKMKLENGDVVRHKRFGVGVVTAIVTTNKAIVTFEDGPRTMVFGRG